MKSRKWTKEEEELLAKLYLDKNLFAKDIAEILGRSKTQIYCHAHAMGLRAPMERIIAAARIGALSEEAVKHRFVKGHVSHNKGKKISPEQYAKVAPTMFKKGMVSLNKKPVGSERVNVDGYVEIKVADPNKWRLKHRWVWEQHYGQIPPGHNIQFKNGNTQDCRIENLYMISRSSQLRDENSYITKYPKELQELIRLKGVVNRQIHKHEKKQNE